jgi:pimeloyl-ACP methyl ester carboxylesterase
MTPQHRSFELGEGRRVEALFFEAPARATNPAASASVASMRSATAETARPTLVFLHEGLGSAAQWHDFPARVVEATGLDALVPSRLGYGGSDPVPLPRPLSYMQDEARHALPSLLAAAGIGDTILVGHSDGGSIAIVHAALSPRVRGVILEAPHVFVEDMAITSIEKARVAYEQGELRARLAKYHLNVDVAFRGWNDAWLDPRFREVFRLERYLPRVRVPVLVVQGEDDAYGTRAQVDAIARGVSGPVETLMLPGCGHAPHHERPDEVLAAMVSFLGRLGLGWER